MRRLVCIAIAASAIAAGRPAVADEATCDDCAQARYDDLVKRGDPHWIRTIIEEALFLGGGTAWYWLDRERQVADWDFPSIEQRFTFEAWRYDNNPFGINFIWHPLNGTAFHLAARANDLSLTSSILTGLGTSLVWELALEFREKVSINDVLTTTGAGVVTGEFMHWLGRYLGSAPAGARGWHGAARWIFGTARTLHHTLDGTSDRRPGSAPDNLCLSSDIWHRFRFSYGLASADVAPAYADDERLTLHQLRLRGELVALPGYLGPGAFTQPFADGNVTTVDLTVTFGDGGPYGDLRADAILLGLHHQRIPEAATGHALTAGMALGYQYRNEELGDWVDRLGLLHLPGPGVDGFLVGPGWKLEARARAHLDFAGIHALPYEVWEAAENPGNVREKSILRKESYYYGWGWSARGELELSLPYLTLGGAAFAGHYISDEGLDRAQEEIVLDPSSDDDVRDYDAWIRITPSAGLYLEGRLHHQDRRARLGNQRADQDLTRWILELGVEL